MVKKSYYKNKRPVGYNSRFYIKQLNKVILVLIILISIFMIKIINTSTSKNVIQIIETNVNYEFSLESDGKKTLDYIKRFIGKTKGSIEIFNIDPNKNILNN